MIECETVTHVVPIVTLVPRAFEITSKHFRRGGLGLHLKLTIPAILKHVPWLDWVTSVGYKTLFLYSLTQAHTDTRLQITTSADASDVTSIRFSARKAKTAAARTERKVRWTLVKCRNVMCSPCE